MIVDAKELYNVLDTGLRLVGEKDTSVHLFIKKSRLNVVFFSPTLKYATKIKVTEDLPDVCIDGILLRRLIANKEGSLTIAKSSSNLDITGKGFKADIPTYKRDVDYTFMGNLFKRPSETTDVDISGLSVLPSSFKKVFASIKDHTTKSELSVLVSWKKSDLKIVVADSFHGVMLSHTMDHEVKKTEISLPLTTFLKVISIENATTHIDQGGANFVVVSNKEFFTGPLKATSNSYITLEMLQQLFSEKSKTSFVVSKALVLPALQSCSALSDAFPIILKSKDKLLRIGMQTDFGSVMESIKISDHKGNPVNIRVNLNNFEDIMACLSNEFEMRCSSNTVMFESVLDSATIHGVCVLHQSED